MLRLFREHPDVLRHYHERFRYMLVDEYQDTNVAQYLWLRLLGQGSKNICCVGDDDQSIYGWRGAEVDNILRFEKDFPGAKVIRLERNYRSTGHILAAASHLIAHNEGRLGKTLCTEDVPGEKVVGHRRVGFGGRGARDRRGDRAAAAPGDDGKPHSLDEIAILVRASFQMREFEDRFVTLGLPYRVIGGPRFYERAEIRDALAYLRLVNQPADDLAFERIVNTPRRGLGDATVQVLHHQARRAERAAAAGRRASDRDRRAEGEAAHRAARPGRRVRPLARARRTRCRTPSSPRSSSTSPATPRCGRPTARPTPPGRLENLKELVRSMEEFENLAGFLEHISLVMDTEKAEGSRGGLDHDPALRQGARIRHRVPARLGGRAVSAPAHARRAGPRRPRGGAPPRLCRAHPRAAARQDLLRLEPPHPRPGDLDSPRASSTNCPRRMSR